MVAVTRERRYGPSRLRVNDDDDDDGRLTETGLISRCPAGCSRWCFPKEKSQLHKIPPFPPSILSLSFPIPFLLPSLPFAPFSFPALNFPFHFLFLSLSFSLAFSFPSLSLPVLFSLALHLPQIQPGGLTLLGPPSGPGRSIALL